MPSAGVSSHTMNHYATVRDKNKTHKYTGIMPIQSLQSETSWTGSCWCDCSEGESEGCGKEKVGMWCIWLRGATPEGTIRRDKGWERSEGKGKGCLTGMWRRAGRGEGGGEGWHGPCSPGEEESVLGDTDRPAVNILCLRHCRAPLSQHQGVPWLSVPLRRAVPRANC